MQVPIQSWLVRITLTLLVVAMTTPAWAQGYRPVVPGTGNKIEEVGDDFEDPAWDYVFNGRKSSEEMDKNERLPAGYSTNERWYEGIKRGHPDVVKRVATPAGGLPDSEGALLLRTLQSGIPGRLTYRQQQDDFICDVNYRLGNTIGVSQSPNCVVRVFFPPVDQWENRTGTHFGFRIAVDTTVRKAGLFGGGRKTEVYWPGMFVNFQSKGDGREFDYAYLRVRANSNGGDYKVKQITTTGWWTMGISVTPDGRVHYFAKPGIEDLTEADYIASEYPYGYRAENFRTLFFNVCNGDDGRTWSTPIVVDDAEVFIGSPRRMAAR